MSPRSPHRTSNSQRHWPAGSCGGLAVILNDSLTLHFGAVLVYPYHGPPQPGAYAANVSVSMSPSTFLAIVQRPAPVFKFLGRRRKASQRELDDVQAVFRTAACNLAPP